jgi:hypothetical protein
MSEHELTKIRKPEVTLRDFAPATNELSEKQAAFVSKLDPDKPLRREDRREDTQVDWKEEEAKGNCIRVRYEGDCNVGGHVGMIGGQPQSHQDLVERRRTFEVMQHIHDTGRLPVKGDGAPAGRIFSHGFGGGKMPVPDFMDHPPFKDKEGNPR